MAFQQKRRRKSFLLSKTCRFCTDKSLDIHYKDIKVLRALVTERGKIIPRRVSGNCAKHQRLVSTQIKVARNIALLPFSVER